MGGKKCGVCGNTDQNLFGYKNGKPYCRRCISFRCKEELGPNSIYIDSDAGLDMPYSLTIEQKRISKTIYKSICEGKNCFVSAVCGSGKTEIVLDVIDKFLKQNKKIGFAIPRKDVVIELTERIQKLFKNTRVISVYGGHKNVLDADIIVLTTHQLYRYNCFFDLLILDEADAFPFKNNEVLQRIFKNSIKGNYIIMSATLDSSQEILPDQNIVNLYLNQRFHKQDIPVPKIVNKKGIFKYAYLIKTVKRYIEEDKPVLIFVPSIKESQSVYNVLKIFAKPGYFVNSKLENRNEIISNFKKGKLKYLVTTMVLERGVTIANLQVIVKDSDHRIFDVNTIIQIAGRVGRKASHPRGDVILLSSFTSPGMSDSIKKIESKNKNKENNIEIIK